MALPSSPSCSNSCSCCSKLSESERRIRLLEEKQSSLNSQLFAAAGPVKTAGNVGKNAAARYSSASPSPSTGELATVRALASPPLRRVSTPPARDLAAPLTLVIGDSISRSIKLARPAKVHCLPGARAPDIEATLRVLADTRAKANVVKTHSHTHSSHSVTNFDNVVIHVGTNDTRMRQSEVTKSSLARVCDLARKVCQHRVIVSGPLPAKGNDERFSRLFSLNRWLANFCKEQNLVYVDNWASFWGKPDWLKRDGLHPNAPGAHLLSKNINHALK
ncbi:uncharacterized protein LOC143007485 [Genypterus blacodes]|uniref:uncharacterized protein LOC143007485 n=1 Tax=Genypterus blacodes TaxID=154954 RepID=UPI003F75D894